MTSHLLKFMLWCLLCLSSMVQPIVAAATDIDPNPLLNVTGAVYSDAPENFYKFTITSPSKVKITAKAETAVSTGGEWQMTLSYKDKGASFNVFGFSGSSAIGTTEEIGLMPGDYYARITADQTWLFGVTFRVVVTATATDFYEQEPNDTAVTATPIGFNTTYTGSSQPLGLKENDYYKFHVPSKGSFQISASPKSAEEPGTSTYGWWTRDIYRGDASTLVAEDNFDVLAGVVRFVTLDPGDYFIKITNDNLNNIPYTLSVDDVTSPVINNIVVTPQPGTRTVIITLDASDNLPGVSYLISERGGAPGADAPWQSSPVFTYTAMRDGMTTLSAWIKDAAGNVANQTFIINVDTTPPYTSPKPIAGTYNQEQIVELTTNEPGSRIFYTTDGTPATTASSIYTGPITVGADTTINFFAVAAAGNRGLDGQAVYHIVFDGVCGASNGRVFRSVAPAELCAVGVSSGIKDSSSVWSWSCYSTKGGATADCAAAKKVGDCNTDGWTNIAEVQSAINMYLGLKNPQPCVDEDGSGDVGIAEVQSTINAYLQIP